MTLTQVWGALLVFIVCPLLGGLPLIAWTTYALTRRRLAKLGTGNISVSAAFYHGGRVAGIAAVLSEALKGIAAVLLARSFFPADPAWELVALMALVVGRYWFGKVQERRTLYGVTLFTTRSRLALSFSLAVLALLFCVNGNRGD
jgi:pyruvate,water dikinase